MAAKDLNPGDLISIDRLLGGYCHWAVYIGVVGGEETVVHLTSVGTSRKMTGGGATTNGSQNRVSSYKDRAQYLEALEEDRKRSKNGPLVGGPILGDICEIKKDTLEVAVDGSSYRKDNSLDGKYRPRSTQDTVKKALAWVGTKVKYNLLYFNCEHFAHLCRNGRLVSCQADIWVDPATIEWIHTIVGDKVFEMIKRDLITNNEESPTGLLSWCTVV